MGRLIDADALIKDIDYSADMGGALGKVVECVKYYAKFMVASAPTVKERKTGKWLPDCEYDGEDEWCFYTCSCCEYQSDDQFKYCPSCGADMRGEEE